MLTQVKKVTLKVDGTDGHRLNNMLNQVEIVRSKV